MCGRSGQNSLHGGAWARAVRHACILTLPGDPKGIHQQLRLFLTASLQDLACSSGHPPSPNAWTVRGAGEGPGAALRLASPNGGPGRARLAGNQGLEWKERNREIRAES